MRQSILTILIIFLAVFTSLFTGLREAKASSVSAGDLISLVNSIRTGSYGLPALIEDSILDATASWTAKEMANNGVCAHLANQGYPGARERIASAGFGGGATIFATENMACATSATLSNIQGWWADAQHMYPMVNATYTHIGAGTYTSSSGITYYVVHAAYVAGGGSTGGTSGGGTTNIISSTTVSQYINPVLTSTPNEDGSIYHIVQYGQALSTIAEFYGVTINQIKTLNDLTSDNIYEGQKLLIKLAPTVTITPTRTPTVMAPTRTPTATRLPVTAKPSLTPTPTPKPGFASTLPKLDRQWLGLGLVAISAVGFFIVLYFSFLKPTRKK